MRKKHLPQRAAWKKSIASAMAFVFLYSTVATPLAEANFWAERRKAARQTSESPQYAQLPARQANPLPIDEQVLQDYSARARAAIERARPAGTSARTEGRQALPRWTRDFITPFGDIQ